MLKDRRLVDRWAILNRSRGPLSEDAEIIEVRGITIQVSTQYWAPNEPGSKSASVLLEPTGYSYIPS